MERTKVNTKQVEDNSQEQVNSNIPQKNWYKKVGGGSFRLLPNKIIKPGEKFQAYPGQIPEAFMDAFIQLDDTQITQNVNENLKVTKPLYVLQVIDNPEISNPDDELYNIVNENGKPINSKPLTKAAAETLILNLQ